MIINKNIVRILMIVISFIVIFSVAVKVDASTVESISELEISSQINYDESGEIPTKEVVKRLAKPLVTRAILLVGVISLIYGIIMVVKKEKKKGIKYILLFCLLIIIVCIIQVFWHDHAILY